ncbi:hypothetical protein P885DRAFT_64434 [Corynascus similis CBS 632.67]
MRRTWEKLTAESTNVTHTEEWDDYRDRIQVASDIKPVEASHYRGKHISMFSDAKEVSVRPGWDDYDYYEPASRISHFELFEKSCVPQTCSFAQHQTETLLSSWTRTTKHTSNAVIAAQSVCPPAMSLEEFRAFGHVRSDHRLQWANVLCQLIIPSLNWNNASTYWLVLQACLEAGPSDHVDLLRREAHADISNESFVRRMVDALNKALDRYRENWQNDVADTENKEKKENEVDTNIDNSVDNEHYKTHATGFRINLLLGFQAVVEDILNHARDSELLHLRDKERSYLEIESNTKDQSSPILLKRAKIRNSAFRVSEFGAEEHTTSHDRRYVGRHQKQGYKTFTKARMVTQRLLSRQQDLLDPPSSKLREDILEISGKQFLGDPDVYLRFNLDYLQPSSGSLSGLWCGLHHALTKERNKYRIAFFLSALIHAKESSWDVVQTLMAFTIVPDRFGLLVAPPLERQFNLEYEISTMLDRVDRIIQKSMYKLSQCPEASLPKLAHESKQHASRRRSYVWKDKSDGMAKSFRSKLEAQWCQGWTVTTPTGDAYSSYMDVNTIMREVSTALGHARRTMDFRDLCTKVPHATNNAEPLTGLFEHLSRIAGDKPYGVSYLQELQNSSASTTKPSFELKQGTASLESIFQEHLLQCKRAAERIRTAIDETLSTKSIVDATFQAACLYPRISPDFLLGRLRQRSWVKLSDDWPNCLVNYGLTLTYLQRAERLVNASSGTGRRTELLQEILNTGSHECEDGDLLAFPESLLLELEQGILIRPVQQGIAAKMREPPNGSNSVMQLNMGEGKSSVIVPIIAAALADGERLVRVVVAKPQSKQMQHTFVATLGGLIDRRIFYLPISRALQLESDGIEAVRRIISSCRKERGVLLVQPEHILSFKLMGLESIYGQSGSLGTQILTTYREFESVSRDIVDESDENFSVKFELIYTIGAQQPIDMSPERWTMIQELMDIVLEVARNLATGPETIKELLFEEDDTRTAASQQFIEAVEGARSGLFSEPVSKNALLLLRGLLVTNVISFALGQKRFRVNYGLAPGRRPATKLAVPYRAKDSPAPRSEFSHPDVVIVLTCLSYYYQGLSSDKLRDCLEILSRSGQAEQEYSRWAAKAPHLPSSLGHFSGVNLRDSTLYKESVFPALRYSKPAIDFYLATVVSPKEMREFPYKLSASGWDLGKTKRHPLTGFSGTSDSKYVLPLSATALDLEEQRHTNSAVLACLLRDENTVLELGGDGANSSSALTVDTLLTAIIELSNLEVAQRWLWLVPHQHADAVIFFNDHDELSVLTRNGSVDLFLTSPFATQTERCLVFLDQAHTRGTDLRLPDSYRAAVTLGPNLVKTPWYKTLALLLLPLWATQGIRHQYQEIVWERAEETGELSVADVEEYLEDEAQGLEQRYRPVSKASGASNSQSLTSKLIKTKDANADEASSLDAYQRPVQWLLTTNIASPHHGMRMVLVSSWEANKLKAILESAKQTTAEARPPVLLRAYLPRSSLSFESLEDLTVYTVPKLSSTAAPPPPNELVTQLNLFAGQLYLRTYDDYVRLCRFLGLSYSENEGDDDIAADGFVGRAAAGGTDAYGKGVSGGDFERVRL